MKDSNEIAIGDGRKGEPEYYYIITARCANTCMTHTVVKLSPAVRWEIEKAPKELMSLAEATYRQTVESTNCFCFVLFLFLAAYEKYMGSKI